MNQFFENIEKVMNILISIEINHYSLINNKTFGY